MVLYDNYEFAFACCSIAAAALLVWDHIITFSAEVSRIWNKKYSGATALYFLLRYGTLLEKVCLLLLVSRYMSSRVCDIAVRFQIFPVILRTLGFYLFSSLRVYALREGKWRLAAFVFSLVVPSILGLAYTFAYQKTQAIGPFGCDIVFTKSRSVHQACVMRLAGVAADIVSETVVIIVTFRRTLHLQGLVRAGTKRPALSTLLLRDGSLYFVSLMILSIADMLVLILNYVPASTVGYVYWIVPYYTPVFRTIIIARFILVLRAIYYDIDEDLESQVGPLTFASRIVGSLGAPLEPLRFADDPVHSGGESDIYEKNDVFSHDPFATGLQGDLADSGLRTDNMCPSSENKI